MINTIYERYINVESIFHLLSATFVTGIARGMSYLHSLRTPTIHGDFKPSDVLIPATDLLTPKIANFVLRKENSKRVVLAVSDSKMGGWMLWPLQSNLGFL